MADPASILGLISASLTITLRAATIGKDLHSLTTKFKGANSKVKQLSVHISAIRIAARSLSSWLEDDVVGSEEVEDVKRDLAEVLSACCDLLSDLQDLIAKALAGNESVGLKGAIRYVWDEESIKETTELLHHQETALLLMLQTLSHIQKSKRQAKLREPMTVEILKNAKRPSSSIFGLDSGSRSSARYSSSSEGSTKLDEVFTFDMEVMASTAYRSAFTSLLRRNITKRTEQLANTGTNRDSVITLKPLNSGLEVDEVGSTIGKEVPPKHRVNTVSQGTVSLTESEAPPNPTTELASRAFPTAVFVRALYDYDSDDIGSLSMRQGDTVRVITILESGWWDGILNGARGWFPSNYCAYIAPSDLVAIDPDSDSDPDEDYLRDHSENKDSEQLDEAEFWISQATIEGRSFYFNTLTGVSTRELLE